MGTSRIRELNVIQVHAPGGLSWVQNACLDTTKIDVDSFKRCFASHIAHMHNVHNVRTYVRNQEPPECDQEHMSRRRRQGASNYTL